MNLKTEQKRKEIAEIERYFASVKLPTRPIRLDGCSTIAHCPTFVKSHLVAAKANNNKQAPYLNRLLQLKQILEQKSKQKKTNQDDTKTLGQ